MKKKSFLILTFFAGLYAMSFLTGCKDDKIVVTGDAKFSYEIDNYTVTFTNESDVTPPVTYSWDFGDGKTSEEENPVHVYEAAGNYTATLTVTDQYDKTHEYSEDIDIVRETGLNFNDGNLDDWGNITEDRLILSTSTEDFVSCKVQYDATYLYVYLEWVGTFDEDHRYNVSYWIDFDNDGSTGYHHPDHWQDYGAEMFVSMRTIGDYSITLLEYTGTDGTMEWSWDGVSTVEGTITMGTIEQHGSNIRSEIRFDRAKLGLRDGSQSLANDEVALGFMILNADWSMVGEAPDPAGRMLLLDMTK